MTLKRLKQGALVGLFAACVGATGTAAGASDAFAAANPSAAADQQIAPGADFARYANSHWDAGTTIPDGADSWSVRAQLRDDNLKKMVALLTQTPQQPWARPLAAYHATQLDLAAIEKKGMAPVRPLLDDIAALKDKTALARYLGRHMRTNPDPLTFNAFDADGLFGLHVGPGLRDTSRHMPYLMQGGLGLASPSAYAPNDPGVDAYRDYVAAMLAEAGMADVRSRAQQIVALESRIARQHASPETSADLDTAGQVWRRADFKAKAKGIDWDAFFDAVGIAPAQAIGAWQPAAIAGISALVASEPLSVWQDYLRFHALNANARFLPTALSERYFAFFDPIFIGPGQHRPWWDHVISQTNAEMPNAGRLFAQAHFSAADKAKVEGMVAQLITAFSRRIDQLAWMSPATRQHAKAKLAALQVGVGHPPAWRAQHGLRIVPGDAFGNEQRLAAFKTKAQLAKIGKPVDRTQWIANAELFGINLMPSLNAITIPMTELQPPMFSLQADDAANYGAIGVRIARFISLALDEKGSRFDAQGRYAPWWSADDAVQYRQAAAPVARQVADLAGLVLAHDALRMVRGGDDVDSDRRFFLAYAASLRAKGRAPATAAQAAGRIALVRHVDAWYGAFGVTPEQAMYLAPAARSKVW